MFEDNELELEQIQEATQEENDESNLIDESEQAKEEDKKDDAEESYSKRVQKRLDKLVYERNIERDKVSDLAARLAEMEAALQSVHDERKTQSLNDANKSLLTQKKAALEIGDYDEVIRLDEEILQQALKEQPRQQEIVIPQAQKDWEEQNQWVFDTGQKARTERANRIFQELLKEGYDVDDPDTFIALDKRIKKTSAPPTGAPDRGQVSGSAKEFTDLDKTMMIGFGLDPNNAKHRVEWQKNRAMK